ncbi:LysR family transcriptional regulator [Altererythrobacter salegens]|uniref:LysR family transcriptional regulator n=1 Tax=Croceibacterium salegens TaxID=1737568 RepID=A0A6I4SRN1_9SPHN|nr:LysR family transcriptional regulator [Croceibacterium salegens]MXO58229.1 LysR family transcriptional regulator [Croceibacterium salegens]
MTDPDNIPPALEPPARSPTARRSHDDYRWTPGKAHAFLTALAQCGKVAEAARSVGMTRQSAYRLKSRSRLFAEHWPRALASGKARRKARGRSRGGAAR